MNADQNLKTSIFVIIPTMNPTTDLNSPKTQSLLFLIRVYSRQLF